MQKAFYCLAATPAIAAFAGVQPAAQAYNPAAQPVSAEQLQAELQSAVCRNDWHRALRAIAPLIGFPGISDPYRQQLVEFKHQLEGWRSAGSYYTNLPACSREITFSQPSDVPNSFNAFDAASGEADDLTVRQLNATMQRAVCQNDWQTALEAIAPLIGSPSITAISRQQLASFRHQLEDWRAVGAAINIPSCSGVAQLPRQ
jgi:hypothetical protein